MIDSRFNASNENRNQKERESYNILVDFELKQKTAVDNSIYWKGGCWKLECFSSTDNESQVEDEICKPVIQV